jgi:hypothetical protein
VRNSYIFSGRDSCFFSGYLAKVLYFHGIIAVILTGMAYSRYALFTLVKLFKNKSIEQQMQEEQKI